MIAETNHGLINAFSAVSGKTADIDAGDVLLNRDMTKVELKRLKILTADKGYGCPIFINLLEKYQGVQAAFYLPKPLLEGKLKSRWEKYIQDETRVRARKKRYVVERVNADLKDNHSLRRCRYLGLSKYYYQVAMSALAYNLKHLVTIMTGSRFKPI